MINEYEYEKFNKNLFGFNLLIKSFIFENQNLKNSSFVNDKRNFPFYYFLGKNSIGIDSIGQIGLCGGYNLGMYLNGNNKVEKCFIYDNKNNNNLLRLTKNNLLRFNFCKKNYYNIHDDFFNSLKENKIKILFVNEKEYIDKNINNLLSFFINLEELKTLVLDNIIDLGKEFEEHIKSYCMIRNILFQKYNKRNQALVLRKN